jgi:PilS N terminal
MTKQSKINALKLSAQRGFSNVQIAIGILVGVIILLGSLGGYQYISQAKVNNEISTLGDLKAATVRYGQFVGVFSATNATAAILNGQNFFNGAGLTVTGTAAAPVVTNQWGGVVTIAVGNGNTAGDSIDFTFPGVPGDACRDLGTKVDNLAAKVTIGGTVTKAVAAATDPAKVTTQCAAGGQNNTIIYTIQK